jgi:hypothetical protein
MLLHEELSKNGRRLMLVPVSDPVRRIFRYCCADYLLSVKG